MSAKLTEGGATGRNTQLGKTYAAPYPPPSALPGISPSRGRLASGALRSAFAATQIRISSPLARSCLISSAFINTTAVDMASAKAAEGWMTLARGM